MEPYFLGSLLLPSAMKPNCQPGFPESLPVPQKLYIADSDSESQTLPYTR